MNMNNSYGNNGMNVPKQNIPNPFLGKKYLK
jgi:hypothetical protein